MHFSDISQVFVKKIRIYWAINSLPPVCSYASCDTNPKHEYFLVLYELTGDN